VTPSSRGTVSLKITNPLDEPLLDPNILSNELDTQLLYEVVRLSSTAVQETLGPKYGVTEYAIEESHRGIYTDSAMRHRVLHGVHTSTMEWNLCHGQWFDNRL